MAVQIGILGYGEMGKWHAERAARLPGFSLRSVYDLTPARRAAAAERHEVHVHDTLVSFLADRTLDVVVVATPSHLHATPVIAALEAGRHVLCEKPLARTEREAARMFAAAARCKRHLLTFQNRRWDSDFLTARRVLESGKLGRALDIRLYRWNYSSLMATFGAREYHPGWRAEKAFGGGLLLDWGAHFFDQLLQLTPAPLESVCAELRNRRWTKDADDQFFAALRFADGVLAILEYAQNPLVEFDVGWCVSGEKAGFRWVGEQGVICTRAPDGREITQKVPAVPTDWEAPYRNLRELLAGRAEPYITPRQTLRVMRLLDAIRKSSQSGKTVRVNDVYAPQRGGTKKLTVVRRRRAARPSGGKRS